MEKPTMQPDHPKGNMRTKRSIPAANGASRATLCLLCSLWMLGCSGQIEGRDPDTSSDAGTTDQPLNCSTRGRDYIGLGGTVLSAGRAEIALGGDRQRLKPFNILAGEFQRLFKAYPTGFDSVHETFTDALAGGHKLKEPQTGAVSSYAFFKYAFDACLRYVNGKPEYAANPTEQTATQVCTDWQRKFWSRIPSQEQIDACVQAATVDAVAAGDAKQRWGYTCAAVLSTSQFLSY